MTFSKRALINSQKEFWIVVPLCFLSAGVMLGIGLLIDALICAIFGTCLFWSVP